MAGNFIYVCFMQKKNRRGRKKDSGGRVSHLLHITLTRDSLLSEKDSFYIFNVVLMFSLKTVGFSTYCKVASSFPPEVCVTELLNKTMSCIVV